MDGKPKTTFWGCKVTKMPSPVLNKEYKMPSRRRFASSGTNACKAWSATNGLAGVFDRQFAGEVWVLDSASRCS